MGLRAALTGQSRTCTPSYPLAPSAVAVGLENDGVSPGQAPDRSLRSQGVRASV